MYTYKKLRQYNSDIHVLTFDPEVFRLDASIGVQNKLERLSQIKGEPKENEYILAKMNGGFFHMNGAAEYIGTFVDEGKYYSGSQKYYPTIIYWKNSNRFTVEVEPAQSRHNVYQKDAHFAIGVPWVLIRDGKIDHIYSKSELIRAFGHPYQNHPRTLIGQKKNGEIVMVVVDGRKATTKGINITNSAKLMQSLECVFAANLDGGGSTEMIINDKIINRLSDGGERAIGTAFLVYGKKSNTTNNKSPSSSNSPTQNITLTKRTVTASLLNTRSGPGTIYPVVGQLPKGSVVYIVSNENGWSKIVNGSSHVYVSSTYLK